MDLPVVVSPAEWDAAREELLEKEKRAMRARDALAAERRRLPMTRVEKEYEFDAPSGRVRLPDLFEGRRQLIVYHHMLKPADPAPCEGCGMFVDQVGHLAHLGSVWTFLDLTPLGRQEEWEDSPAGYPQGAPYGWWRLHDEYDGSPGAA